MEDDEDNGRMSCGCCACCGCSCERNCEDCGEDYEGTYHECATKEVLEND